MRVIIITTLLICCTFGGRPIDDLKREINDLKRYEDQARKQGQDYKDYAFKRLGMERDLELKNYGIHVHHEPMKGETDAALTNEVRKQEKAYKATGPFVALASLWHGVFKDITEEATEITEIKPLADGTCTEVEIVDRYEIVYSTN